MYLTIITSLRLLNFNRYFIFLANVWLRNVKTRRYVFPRGGSVTKERGSEGGVNSANRVVGSDRLYYNRGGWKIIHQGKSTYIFQSADNGRYLYSMGDEIQVYRGFEGGTTEAPLCLASDDNYDNRALWRIISKGEGKYLIESVVNFRYLLSKGEPPRRSEGGWLNSPECVMSDANYDDRALWYIS